MKRILKFGLFRFFAATGMVIVLLTSLWGCAKKVEIGEINSFSYSYSCGNTVYANVQYSLRLEDGTYIAAVKPAHEPPEAVRTYLVSESFVQELRQLLIDNEVGKWNGFDKRSRTVMDGDGFDLFIYMEDDTCLSASGYMKWPKNYSAVRDGLDRLFSERLGQETELEIPLA